MIIYLATKIVSYWLRKLILTFDPALLLLLYLLPWTIANAKFSIIRENMSPNITLDTIFPVLHITIGLSMFLPSVMPVVVI